MSVDKYSHSSKTCSKVADMYEYRRYFCACTFMDKVFIFGGNIGGSRTNSCLEFDTSDYSWKEISRMNEAISDAACAVFAERILISGGFYINCNNSKNVESYDVLPNKWSSMPNMTSAKYGHSLVVVNDKLFVISNRRDSCKVYDNNCKMFITIKSPQLKGQYAVNKSYSIGKTIFIFQYESLILISFDSEKNKWSKEPCKVTRNLIRFSCVKVPYLYENI